MHRATEWFNTIEIASGTENIMNEIPALDTVRKQIEAI